MTEEFIVGCPVYKRDWILDRWFDHVERACESAGVSPVYAFVVDPRDEDTLKVISNHAGAGYVFGVQEKAEHEDVREWHADRYRWMVEIRNELLGVVRLVEPRLFLSLDSDILLHPDAIKNMMETIETCDAVGGKAYMTDGRSHPSWASISRSGGLSRRDADGVFPVQVIMAVKLMSPAAYKIDYKFNDRGEDVGWSLACADAGVKLKWDGRVTNKHVMRPEQLNEVDRRVGF